jgi:nitrogen regulatory protein P-II 1
MVLALIQPTRLSAVQEALSKIGVERMTVCDAQGYGRAPLATRAENLPASERSGRLLRKVALEIAVNEDFLERTVDTIATVARSGAEGSMGDGKVFVLPLEEVVRLSDTVRGPEAVS